MNGLLIFALLLVAYLGVVYALRRRGGSWRGFEVNGPFIMWRTQLGKGMMERVARPRRFWNAVADAGIWATWIVGLLVLLLFVVNFAFTAYLSYTRPQAIADSAQSPEFFLGLPGVNPLIPLGYGVAALVVALVIHEGSHAVMAYVGRIRVKSSGLLFFIAPIGAFVEPDEVDMEKASARERNRVFAAGPTSNLVVALVAGLLLSTVVMSSVSLVNGGEGVIVGNVSPDTPAAAAGLRPGDLLTAVNGARVADAAAFSEVMNATAANQSIELQVLRDQAPLTLTAVLADKELYYEQQAPAGNWSSFSNKGFLGIGHVSMSTLAQRRDALESPFSSFGAFFVYTQYPLFVFFDGMDVFNEPYRQLTIVDGPLAGLGRDAFFGLAALLFWIVWINLTLGTFNALPAGPLDGGQMLKTTLRDRLLRRHGVDRDRLEVQRVDFGGAKLVGKDEETQKKLDEVARIQKKATWTVGLSVLALLLFPILGPHLLRLLL